MADRQRGTPLVVVASLAALLVTAPRPPMAVALVTGAVTGTDPGTDPTAPVVAAVALLAWAVAGWLSLTVVVVVLSRVPGLLGRTARVLGERLAPAAVRRAVEAALGLTVAVAALTPGAALAAPPSPSARAAAEAAWDLDWPGRTAGPPLPTSTSSPPPPQAPVAPVRVTPSQPKSVAAPRPVLPAALPVPPPRTTRPDVVVVRTGDSLWSLAEAALRSAGTAAPTDRHVAQAWPRWWAANREAVGDDPDLLLPGTVLRPPPGGPGPA